MSVEENRNYGTCCNSENMVSDIMDDCNNKEEKSCEDLMNTKDELMKKIKCLDFAIIELALYLDTHPDDKKALCLHNSYCNEAKDLKDKYQKVYGPLTINYPCNKWRWLENPWPWERGNN